MAAIAGDRGGSGRPTADRLGSLLARARALRDQLARDGQRLEALAQAVRDEAWQAGARRAMPDGREDQRFRNATGALWRVIDEELGRLERLLPALGERNRP